MAKTCGFCPCLRWRKPRAALPGMAPGGRRQGAKRPKRAGPGARSFCLAGQGAFGPRAAKRRRPPGAIPGRAARARRRGGPFPKVAGQRPWNMGERLSFRLGPFLKNGFGWPADSPRMGRGRLSALGDAGASEGGGGGVWRLPGAEGPWEPAKRKSPGGGLRPPPGDFRALRAPAAPLGALEFPRKGHEKARPIPMGRERGPFWWAGCPGKSQGRRGSGPISMGAAPEAGKGNRPGPGPARPHPTIGPSYSRNGRSNPPPQSPDVYGNRCCQCYWR